MLPDNGKPIKEKRNLHMTLEELTIILEHIKKRYAMRAYLAVIYQFAMGQRCSETLATNVADFSGHFRKVDYRQAKTNKMIYDEPVPEALGKLIISFLVTNGHTCVDGHFFPRHVGKGPMNTETYNTMWCRWRKEIGKTRPEFLDKYPHYLYRCDLCRLKWSEEERRTDDIGTTCPRCKSVLRKEFKKWTYRVASHSLRRLHRTLLSDNHPDKLFLLSKLCHYEKFEKFETYVNQYKLMQQRMEIIMPIINPIVHQIMRMPKDQTKITSFV